MSNAELRPVGTTTVAGREPAGSNPLLASVSRLVPRSGIQFIDFALDTSSFGTTVGRFIEESDADEGPLLIPLSDGPDCDGVEWHPLTGERLAPSQSLWVSGYQAVEPFLDKWLPLPYFRFLGRNEQGDSRFDNGPSNWVRIFIEKPAEDLRKVETLKAVLAIDTQIDGRSRIELEDYLGPNVDDVVFAPIFRLVSDVAHVGDYLCAGWFEEWLERLWSQDASHRPADGGSSTPAFALEHIARYLSLLNVLAAAKGLPQLQFIDTRTAHWRSRASSVDLLIDIGSPFANAAIMPAKTERTPAPEQAESLRLRDLSRPSVIHHGPFPALAEFSAPNFGDEHASMRSGRAEAFYWPSLVRIGTEGLRLAQSGGAVPGLTGLHVMAGADRQTEPHDALWRFARAGSQDQLSDPGPMVSGRLLSHLTEDGQVIGADDVENAPALRPRFSAASVYSMAIGECVLHTLAQIHDPAGLGRNGQLRTLKRVIVTCPPSAGADERDGIKKRAEDALALIWSAMGWDGNGEMDPPLPQVAIGFDATIASQVVYLSDQLANRFSGAIGEFMSLVCAPDPAGGTQRTSHLRIAALDMAGSATSLSVVNYTLGPQREFKPRIEIADRTGVCGDSLIETVMNEHILPAIARALDAAGHPDGAALMLRACQGSNDEEFAARHFSAGFVRKVLIPAATALIDLHEAASGGGHGHLVRRSTLGHLVRLGDGRMRPYDLRLESAAAAQGARAFVLADVIVANDPREVSRTIEQHYGPTLRHACDAIRQVNADIVLLSGRWADLPDIERLTQALLPLAPHRIINMNERMQRPAGDGAQSDAGAGADPCLEMLIGAALCGRGPQQQVHRVALLAQELRLVSPPETATGWLAGERTLMAAHTRFFPAADDTAAPVLLQDASDRSDSSSRPQAEGAA